MSDIARLDLINIVQWVCIIALAIWVFNIWRNQ